MATQCDGLAFRVKEFPEVVGRGVGQVMFQDSGWTGLLFLIGIFWGAYECGTPLVAWGALVGIVVSTLTGYLLGLPDDKGSQGLWGFNGVLVGCAFMTFLPDAPATWVALALASAMTTWARAGLNRVMAPWGVNSLTFPFVLTTWLFLLAARFLGGLRPTVLPTPELVWQVEAVGRASTSEMVEWWLRGVSQVFLIDSWVTGVLFLIGLSLSSGRAALWAAIGSGVALLAASAFGAPADGVSAGLYGFSATLTGIALGDTFGGRGWRSWLWAITGVVATVFIQAGMNALVAPLGLPTLTAPFCVATWLFLLPGLKWADR